MVSYIKAELLKQKHSFNNRIIWLMPIISVVLSFLLMGSKYVQSNSYNWWYILFLPFTFTYVSATIVSKDKKSNYHGLFSIVKNKKDLWYSKILTSTIYLFLTCLIFLILSIVSWFVFNKQISIINSVFASLLLFITFAWQIPLFMYITLKTHMFLSIILSVVCNLVIACIYAVKSCWWIPFSIPARIMCPVIKVLPNGLLMEPNDPLNTVNVIWIGILITVALYILFTVVTAKLFEREEA